jgi:hypothetical protein
VTKKNPNDLITEALSVATSVAYTKKEISKLRNEIDSLKEERVVEVVEGPQGDQGPRGFMGPKGDRQRRSGFNWSRRVLRDYKVRRVIKEMKVSVEKGRDWRTRTSRTTKANKVHREKRVHRRKRSSGRTRTSRNYKVKKVIVVSKVHKER